MKLLTICQLTAATTLLATFTGCGQKENATGQHRVTVGISYQNLQNEFIINIQDAVRAEAKN